MVVIYAHGCLNVGLGKVGNITELMSHLLLLLHGVFYFRLPSISFFLSHFEVLVEELFELRLLGVFTHVEVWVGEGFLLLCRHGTRSLSCHIEHLHRVS